MNKDKICKNCEYYKCERSIKNGFLGASVECRYSKENRCTAYKDRVIASPDCHCNCGRFKLWFAIQNQTEKEKAEKEQKKQNEINKRIQAQERLRETNDSTDASHSFEYKLNNDVSIDDKDDEVELIEDSKVNVKKSPIAPIVLTVLSTFLLTLGIIFKVIAKAVINRNEGSSSYYAQENINNAHITSGLGIFLIILSTVIVILVWIVWYIKYRKH